MTKIWAHRGASGKAPENTIPAFELAIAMGADGVEFDVNRTADGELVVIHDETLDRTTTGTGRVVDLTLDEIRKADASHGQAAYEGVQVPTLREVLELFRGTGLTVNVELKSSIELYPGIEHDALAVVDELGMREQVLWSSFNHNTLLPLVDEVGRDAVALLFADALVKPWDYAAALGAGALHPGLHLLQDPAYIEAAHALDLKVNTWTVNSPGHCRLAAAAGVDAIITNHPDDARAAVEGGR